ncbi:CCR4-NOT transcription complex subunit 10-like [Juglans microcarpa x Juglans regia]|uniref:CCR4-NOT transcription complex subunit 10-like n=1 Tax=Juglans microcarpa x Juglans regia TaxID=2249226 RepID=UPI001B7E62D4|nr:CCR4-NOT transcription complex subunit 10-like [Juglans microcarpa x Juglans regia]
MDLRDSSSSTAAAAPNRDGSSGSDEDALLSVAAALAKDAALHFQSGNFAECVEVLKQLLLKKENDPKVLHNVAIAEFFRDGGSDPKKLLEALNNVKKRIEELASASGEQVEAASNLLNKLTLGSKGSTMTHQLSGANSSNVVYTDEFDTSVAILNIGVIWFHLHEYAKALSVLEPLYQNIEPIDETTALHICLLLLDVGLACNDAMKSADILSYMERAFGVGCMSQGDNGNTTQQLSGNLVAKSSSIPLSSSSAMDVSHSDLAASVNASENFLSRTLSEEALEYETMLSTLDIGGRNSVRPSGLSPPTNLPRTAVDRSFTTVDLKLKLHLYKVRFLLLTRNLKQAKREVKHVMNIARGKDLSMALLLKSQIEYARGNHRKAIKLLVASSNRTDMTISSIFNNNLGCIYYQLGKYHTSSIFFSKALTNTSYLRKEKPLKLSTFSQDNSFLIVYNCGIQYLACGKPILAARCFQKASLVFYNRPLLWLRLAECCLMALEKGLIKANHSPSERSEVKVHVIGQGKWRQLLVEDGILRNRHVDSVEGDDCMLCSEGQLKLSMLLARRCLHNALQLLNCSESNHSKYDLSSNTSLEENESSGAASSRNSNHKNLQNIDSKTFTVTVGLGQVHANGDAKEMKGGTSQELMQNSLSYYEDICRNENQLIKQSILANLAFVELELENPMKALSITRSLLELPECSRIYIFLGHVYAAEALCLLNRPKEAAENLLIYFSGGNNFDLPFSEEDCEQWRVERTVDSEELNGGSVTAKKNSTEDSQGIVFLKPEEARAALYSNFAAVSAMQGQLEQAHQFATQALSILPNSREATLTSIYVDLMLGKSREALAKLKQYSRVRFLPSGVTMNRSS